LLLTTCESSGRRPGHAYRQPTGRPLPPRASTLDPMAHLGLITELDDDYDEAIAF
jgi:hypothetical protein